MLGHFVMAGVVAFVALACVGLAAGAGFFAWCCCTCATTFNVGVMGCGASLSGLTVTIKQGATTLATGVTDGTGFVSLVADGDIDSSVTLEVTAPTHYDNHSAGYTLDCETHVVSVILLPSTGYTCTEDGCCPQGGTAPYPILTFPTTLTLTDPVGDITLSNGGSGFTWTGTATRTADPYVKDLSAGCAFTTGSTTVTFTVSRSDGGTCWVLELFTSHSGCSAQEVVGPTWVIRFPGDGSPPYGPWVVLLSATSHECDPITADFEGDFYAVDFSGNSFTNWPYYIYGETASFALSE